MNNSIKSRIYQLVDDIQDENILNLVMEDVAFYASKKDIIDTLTFEQLHELDTGIKEADSNETVSWNDFKNDMEEWRQK